MTPQINKKIKNTQDVKCYWSFDGSCENIAEYICPECGRAYCSPCAEETQEIEGRCNGVCLERVPRLIEIDLVKKSFLKHANKI